LVKVVIGHISNQFFIQSLSSNVVSDKQIEVSLGIPNGILLGSLVEIDNSIDNTL
jgi:hypothetical protein